MSAHVYLPPARTQFAAYVRIAIAPARNDSACQLRIHSCGSTPLTYFSSGITSTRPEHDAVEPSSPRRHTRTVFGGCQAAAISSAKSVSPFMRRSISARASGRRSPDRSSSSSMPSAHRSGISSAGMSSSSRGSGELHAPPAAIAIVHTTDRSGVRLAHESACIPSRSLDGIFMRRWRCIAQTTYLRAHRTI